MAVRHVRAGHEEHVGMFEVLIGTGRSVSPERLLVSGAGTCHAQSGIRFDLIGPDEALGQFVRQVLSFE